MSKKCKFICDICEVAFINANRHTIGDKKSMSRMFI